MAENIRTTPLRLRPNEHRAILIIGDLLMAIGSLFLALHIWRLYNEYNLDILYEQYIAQGIGPRIAQQLAEGSTVFEIPFWFYILPVVWVLLLVEMYDPHVASSGRKTTRGIAIAALFGLIAYSLAFIIQQESNLPRIGVGAFLLLASILTLTWRMVFIRLYKSTGQRRRVLIVGAGKAGQTLAELYRNQDTHSFNIVGFVDDDGQKAGKIFHGIPVLGTTYNLLNLIEVYRVSDLVVAISGEIKGTAFQIILDAQERGVDVTRMPLLYEEMTSRVPVHHLESDWIIRSFVDGLHVSGFYELTKRLLDIVGALFGLLIFAILFPFLALAIWLDTGLPVLYSQDRLGRGGTRFKIYKFRSMSKDADADGSPFTTMENDPRVTRVGAFLRRARLDELPQFLSVLKGEMSLVGPRAERPSLVNEYQKQIPFYRARLLVKPGLTGWAQINYGYVSSVTETVIKLEYDLYYIKHRTLGMDAAIILRTIGTVVRQTGR
ncbi:MAG TPA: sugar transferase [Anaerolineales bacterium]|nr:sugar transferase [Anaerolineales bacterium]